MTRLVVAVIVFYRRFLSPQMAANCRFQPTCSAYGVVALERHGLLRGGSMALRRVTRCHPLRPGGLDPVATVVDNGMPKETING